MAGPHRTDAKLSMTRSAPPPCRPVSTNPTWESAFCHRSRLRNTPVIIVVRRPDRDGQPGEEHERTDTEKMLEG